MKQLPSMKEPFRISVAAVISIVLASMSIYAIVRSLQERKVAAHFPPENVACVDQAFEHLENVKIRDGYMLADFDYSKDRIASMSCAATRGMLFYQIEGTDTASHSFFIHAIAGGTAASGADMIDDFCYKKDGIAVIAIRRTGRDGTQTQSACSHEAGFMSEAESKYSFVRK